MKCKRCGKIFKLGRNGTVRGCDTCNAVQREPDGTAWYPEDIYQDRMPVDGKYPDDVYRITREEAFKKEA